MKFSTFLVAALAVVGVVAAAAQPAAAGNLPAVKSAAEALQMLEASELPDGVTLMGTSEKIDPPAGAAAAIAAKEADNKHDGDADKKEQYGGWGLGLGAGWGLGGGWGNWGGWGGYGPYRFGFMCGGVPGWAYPMGYWNMFGAGLYGGSCGLGMPFGGLYYC
ncbi:hypothetical protein PHYSODRAFT_335335 [Phytophthora sojae]|uniref:Uncharacterized protein n=1 Tax=Phytophthora sojae (strain P6497) TaxID=1094619 RepID=G4ZUT7_PHYSP|nr:hypothetical protein PHYSODRAFT_335317 [Phytophthora sojae]XP_009530990.1 hypothetical protein PHYSODRAFT_335318 [Phytophthora sojae]XP_009530993.1 hypothetical protein PHYSODRAFT_335321 [Phytophthora sojae]XP_009530994.1 hypothetical protein PHYSODRAFT_335322 [Phytophthora sojae]XP_009531005.1 hypothetical protein PHYSODRAFT_335335 [Phytophthora sojae]EGZ13560.1 hypothetical protein PHYSODRAFT_335317 [Phytophthora sojae]EGZ13561.1 hypothetical protein PHYSODRAFT_335318 [Phytophthora sojae|eukprot:XP_009530989.1 hypothetical protein PHYSODRAFT_335317 [Phytophthora sojae]